ncbi:MAG: acyl-CoA thioesterase II [Propionicimonas sp.]|uniref:acyl-CoA thioesterase n=1 Tax=Propionicimonas sp. TaxID=1955623 RepID=UPI002B1F7184|nr:acyl-CoA thioesterase II [Propionicimonas sp.]MEA4943677.1 acyl-CoA thioesterase II [Propionicimonas sp.]MEA5052763.1 acyl-CoA thioesterase II [Propionicimonas sp.]MEA5117115.1 acyl-CoA thioesterase II [Propionicimonas sp.]
MPSSVDQLIGLLDLEQTGEREYIGAADASSQRQRVFGGQVLAQALMAAYHTVPPERIAHSLSAYYLRGGLAGVPISYRVEGTRDGRNFSTRRVVAGQSGRTIFSMECSFHLLEAGLNHADAAPAGVPLPQDCPPLSEVLGARSRRSVEAWQREWGVLETRFASDTSGLPGINGEGHDAAMKVWVRAESALPGDPRVHQAVLAYLSDLTLLAVSTVPHPVEFAGPGMVAASINHAMWFHRPARADEWLLYDQVSPSASAGLGFSFGRLFSGGRLVASCAQEGLIRITDLDALAN